MDCLSQIYTGLVTNPVMYRLAEEMKLPRGKVSPNRTAFIMMQGVWSWMDVNSIGKDIGSCPLQAVADAAGWPGKPEVFFDALINSGLVVKEEDGTYSLRSWREYVFILSENGETDTVSENTKEDLRREKNRERQRRFRDRQKHEDGSVTDNVTGVTDSVMDNVTDSVTTNVTDSVTTNVTTNVNVERNVVRNSNSNNNIIITNVPRNTYTLPTVTLESSNDKQEGVTDNVTQGVTDNVAESVTGNSDSSVENIIHHLNAYFEEKLNQKISLSLIKSFKISIDSGMDAAVLYEVIDETALRNIDNPSCYIFKIIARLCQENVKDLPAYRERNKRYQSRFSKTGYCGASYTENTGAPQEMVYNGFTPAPMSDPSIVGFEECWLSNVRSYLGSRDNETTNAAV